MVTGALEVLLFDAEGIKEKDIFSLCAKINPYVLVHYGNQEHKSCVAQGHGKKRVWNEKIVFHVQYPDAEDQKHKLTLSLMDMHKHLGDTFVGETTIYLKDVVSLGVETGRTELLRSKYRIVLPDKTYAGEVTLAATFTVNA